MYYSVVSHIDTTLIMTFGSLQYIWFLIHKYSFVGELYAI